MGNLRQFYYPPHNWQDFELLTQSVAKHVFDCPMPDMIGSPGQSQDGVDVIVQANGKWIGIQCKRRLERDKNNNPLPGGVVNRTFLIDALSDAKSFKPKLDVFILATTAQREADMQAVARELTRERAQIGESAVKLWFWDDYITYINNFDALERLYYDSIIHVRTPEDQDRKIIDLMGQAFNRPAFTDAINNEHGERFDQALADTVHALNNGELTDRQTRHVFRSTFGGRSAVLRPGWRAVLDDLYDDVAQLRSVYALGVKQRRIELKNGYLEVHDPALEHFLEHKRRECIGRVNKLLADAGLPAI